MEKLRQLVGDSPLITVIGLCKNAGKTTVLCRLLYELSGEALAVTSIGRDGESTDLVTSTPKPEILLREGNLFATTRGMLPLCRLTVEVLDVTDMYTPLGEVAVFRALTPGTVQLAGPSMISQLARLCGIFRTFGAQRILIDGAAGRKSPAGAWEGATAILCTGASMDTNMASVVAETAHICNLFATPVGTPEELAAAEKVGGGVTNSLLEQFSERKEPVVVAVPDATHLLADRITVERFFRRGGRFLVHRFIPVAAVAANPWSAYGHHFEPEAFMNALRERIQLPIINIKEGVQCC